MSNYIYAVEVYLGHNYFDGTYREVKGVFTDFIRAQRYAKGLVYKINNQPEYRHQFYMRDTDGSWKVSIVLCSLNLPGVTPKWIYRYSSRDGVGEWEDNFDGTSNC